MPDIKNTATSYPLTEWEIQQQTITDLTAQRDSLLASLKECREAVAAAMRVVTDLDTAHLLRLDSETRQQRFVDELHASGVRDGFGVRSAAAIAKAEGR